MAKIDQAFPYDAYKFLIQGIRDADSNGVLERWMGGIQTQFEATHRRITELPDLSDPLAVDPEVLQFLKWIVGFNDDPALAWTDNVNDATLRKLIKNAVSLWKTKGSRDGIASFLNAFTGKSALIRDWFFHRALLDEFDGHMGGGPGDPWLYGERYSDKDESLSYLFVNRSGVTDSDKLMIYNLLDYINPAGAHFGVVYAAFVDNFENGLLLWNDIGSEATTVDSQGRAVFGVTTGAAVHEIAPNLPSSEFATWTRVRAQISVVFDAAAGATDTITLNIHRPDLLSDGYKVTLGADGTWTITHPVLGSSSSTVELPPIDPATGETPRILIEVRIEPTSQGSADFVILIEGIPVIVAATDGDGVLTDIDGGMSISGSPNGVGTVFVDFVTVLASPMHVQFIGQRTTLPSGIADPDPGREPVVSAQLEPALQPFVSYEAMSAADWAVWTDTSLWHNDVFAALSDKTTAKWFSQNGVGRFPLQTVDPDYNGAFSGTTKSPTIDFSRYLAADYTGDVRLWYRPSVQIPTPATPETVELGYDIGAGFVLIAAIPASGGSSVDLSDVGANLGEPDVLSGVGWWREVLIALPPAVFGEVSVNLILRFTSNATYTDTGYGWGFTRLAVELSRA